MAPSTPALWQVDSRDGQGRLYLLGSIHFGNPGLYPLPSYVNQAFKDSEVLAVELDPQRLDPAEVSLVLTNYGRLPTGQLLKDYLPESDWHKLQALLNASGLPAETMQRLKPWLVAVQLTAAQVRRAGFSEGYGIDRHFLTLARHPEAPKQILELESFRQQMAMFDGLSHRAQVEFLLQSLEDSELAPRTLDQLIKAWRKGDQQALEGLVAEAFGTDTTPLYDRVFVRRNDLMQERLLAELRRGERLFVVVGAGHVVGDDGLVARFRALGYTVQRLQ
nr:TraB/GumN family protein [Pseudomaricurvus sp. HS19]